MATRTDTSAAEELLDGAWYGTRLHYYADEIREYCSVTRAEVRLLARMLSDGSISDAYSEWCAITPTRVVSRYHQRCRARDVRRRIQALA